MAQDSVHDTIFLNPEGNKRNTRGKKRAQRRAVSVMEEEPLSVIGYVCHFYEDDDMAEFCNSENALLPWNRDESLKMDRYDVRHLLEDLSGIRRRRPGPVSSDVDEAELDKERYLDLEDQGAHDDALGSEDVTQAACKQYAAVAFSYAPDPDVNGGQQQLGPDGKEGRQAAYDSFRPSFPVPAELEASLPSSQKLHQIMAHTAKFVIAHGGQAEIVLRVKQANNPNFDFLVPDHGLHPYFRFLVAHPEHVMGPGKEGKVKNERKETGEERTGKAPAQDAIALLGAAYGDEEDVEQDTEEAAKEGGVVGEGESKKKGAKLLSTVEGKGSEGEASFKQEDDRVSNAAGEEEAQLAQPVTVNEAPEEVAVDMHKVCTAHSLQPSEEGAGMAEAGASSERQLGGADLRSESKTGPPPIESQEEPPPPGTEALEQGTEWLPTGMAEEPLKEPPVQLHRIIAKMVEFISRNGRDFESIIRERDKTEGRFPFLAPGHEWHRYFAHLLAAALKKESGSSNTGLAVLGDAAKEGHASLDHGDQSGGVGGAQEDSTARADVGSQQTSAEVERLSDVGQAVALALEKAGGDAAATEGEVQQSECLPEDVSSEQEAEKVKMEEGSHKAAESSGEEVQEEGEGTGLTVGEGEEEEPGILKESEAFLKSARGVAEPTGDIIPHLVSEQPASPTAGKGHGQGDDDKGPRGMSIDAVAAAVQAATRGKLLQPKGESEEPSPAEVPGGPGSAAVSGRSQGAVAQGSEGSGAAVRSTADVMALLRRATARRGRGGSVPRQSNDVLPNDASGGGSGIPGVVVPGAASGPRSDLALGPQVLQGGSKTERSDTPAKSHEELVIAAHVAAKAAVLAAAGEADSADVHLSAGEKRKAERLKKAKLFAAMLKGGAEGAAAASFPGSGSAGLGLSGKGTAKSERKGEDLRRSGRELDSQGGPAVANGLMSAGRFAARDGETDKNHGGPERVRAQPAVIGREVESGELEIDYGKDAGKGDGEEGGDEGGGEDVSEAGKEGEVLVKAGGSDKEATLSGERKQSRENERRKNKRKKRSRRPRGEDEDEEDREERRMRRKTRAEEDEDSRRWRRLVDKDEHRKMNEERKVGRRSVEDREEERGRWKRRDQEEEDERTEDERRRKRKPGGGGGEDEEMGARQRKDSKKDDEGEETDEEKRRKKKAQEEEEEGRRRKRRGNNDIEDDDMGGEGRSRSGVMKDDKEEGSRRRRRHNSDEDDGVKERTRKRRTHEEDRGRKRRADESDKEIEDRKKPRKPTTGKEEQGRGRKRRDGERDRDEETEEKRRKRSNAEEGHPKSTGKRRQDKTDVDYSRQRKKRQQEREEDEREGAHSDRDTSYEVDDEEEGAEEVWATVKQKRKGGSGTDDNDSGDREGKRYRKAKEKGMDAVGDDAIAEQQNSAADASKPLDVPDDIRAKVRAMLLGM